MVVCTLCACALKMSEIYAEILKCNLHSLRQSLYPLSCLCATKEIISNSGLNILCIHSYKTAMNLI